ncbi:prephenate dehydrogenase [Aeromicrobium sp. A1-2]|uniref:prephenate dehydrogenase n=1 Tax=Aeromicrobium sp. A1-2 TaxID=2107713 RepID=UPI000E47632E|nr:prephenate dehydrogenase [Aeromicrobium sp. A1-2]AXT85259.1 prephenate dehydrogenase [Aeromicrobium sp. A1-2]
MTSAPPGPVLVIGCGLIGTSAALALTEAGVEVHLEDIRSSNLELAVSRGAGTADPVAAPALVIVAVPPAGVVATVKRALETWPDATVTDVASVKAELQTRITDLVGSSRYVGSHPMAGSERSGPMAASSRLFEGRPWAVTTAPGTDPQATARVVAVAGIVGGVPLVMDASAHDRAVALVSHVPHVLSVLAAARLEGAPEEHLALAGPGLRDVTRIAGSDTALWQDILGSNADQVRAVLQHVREDLDRVIDSIGADADRLGRVLQSGQDGTRLIPGKHGTKVADLATVFVSVPDHPGELSRLMAHTGESAVNIEDIRIDHELGRPVGQVEIAVVAASADTLVEALTARGWSAYR